MASLRIHLLDGFEAQGENGQSIATPTPRQQELLACLLLHRHAPQSRFRIASLLWAETTDSQARSNLRRELFRLRDLWPDVVRWLETEGQNLRWRMGEDVRLDVADFEADIRQADRARDANDSEEEIAALQRAVDGYRGPLLPSSYADWILAERERLAQQHIRALTRLTELHESQRNYDAAISTAQRLLRHDPLAESTYRQLMGLYAAAGDRPQALRTYHTCATILRQELGVDPDPETDALYQRLLSREKEAQPEETGRQTPGQGALVGRQREWSEMLTLWRRSAAGQAHFLLIGGEAGIGKSRLAEELYGWVRRQGLIAARSRAYAAEGGLAYLPAVEWLRSEALRPALARLDPLWLGEVCRLLPELLADYPHISPPPPLTESWQRRQMLEGLCRACIADGQPRLLLLDDLQWCDEATLHWLGFFLRFALASPLLIVGTVRPHEVATGHPLAALLDELRGEGQVTELLLGPLSREESVELAEQTHGRLLDPALYEPLLAETGGNPLFVVETVKAGVERVVEREQQTAGERFLPTRIYALIRSRLERVSAPARQVIGLAAAIGRSFRFDVLAAAAPLEEGVLVDALDELWQAGIVRAQGTDDYDFSHDRIRDVAYAEVSPIRRPHLHRAIAQALEQVYVGALDEVAPRLAAHWSAAGEWRRAAQCFQQAGEVALQRLAYAEVVAHFGEALAALEKLPQGRAVKEQMLGLLLREAEPLRVFTGWVSERKALHTVQVVALSKEVGTPRQQMDALNTLKSDLMMRGKQREALACARQALQLSAEHSDRLSRRDVAEAEIQVAVILMRTGQQLTAQEFFAGKEDETWRPSCHWEIHTLWLMGYGGQARRRLDEIRAIGDRRPADWLVSHTVGLQACYGMRTDEQMEGLVAELVAGAGQYEAVFWAATGSLFRGWLRANRGEIAAGLGQMTEAIQRYAETGCGVLTLFLDMLASAYAGAGQYADALATLERAIAYADDGGEHFWYAELLRHKAEILLATGAEAAEAEALFQQAIQTAHSQGARLLELRAAVSLGRLWHSQGRAVEARAFVTPLYNWFTEGFDSTDLVDAREFLDQLQ